MSSKEPLNPLYEPHLHEPLSTHISALRTLFLRVGSILLLGTLLSLYFSETVVEEITSPFKQLDRPQTLEWLRFENPTSTPKSYPLKPQSEVVKMAEGSLYESDLVLKLVLKPHGWAEVKTPLQPQLTLFSPTEGFLLSLKVAFWSSLVLLSPLWLVPLWLFVRPALHPREAKLFFPFLALSFLLMGLGALLALKVTLPLTTGYFFDFNESLGKNLWGLSAYVEYWLSLVSAHMLSFQSLTVLLFLIEMGYLTHKKLKEQRKTVFVLSLIVGATLTPPDVLSQILVALPLIGLFELALLFARWREVGHRRGRSCRADRATLSIH